MKALTSKFKPIAIRIQFLFFLFLFLGWGPPLFSGTIAIRGGEIHTMDGKIIRSGTILIKEGKIVEIGEDIQIPRDAEIVDARGYMLYPGFVASSGQFSAGENINFESFTPDTSALDRFDLHGDYALFIRGGITSAYVSMPANRVISGRGAVVKLGNSGRLSSVLNPEAALNINLIREAVLPPMTDIFPAPITTENPIVHSFKQYPSSSLGAFWLLTELFRFEPYSGDLAQYFGNISFSLKTLQGRGLPLIIRCEKASEIRQAVELARALKMPLIIQRATEAYRVIDIIKNNNVSVIAEALVKPNGQSPGGSATGDADLENQLANIPALIRQGIPVAIIPDEERYLPDLLWVVQYFQKFGISQEELFKTMTINPAKMFGLEDRIGCLGKGRDADILFLKNTAGKPLPRLEKVMIEGRIVYEEK